MQVNAVYPASGKSCVIKSCDANRRYNRDLKFFRFPKNTELREKWISMCQIDTTNKALNIDTVMICSRHFAPNCIGKKLLRHRSVPTLLLDTLEKRTNDDEMERTRNSKKVSSEVQLKLMLDVIGQNKIMIEPSTNEVTCKRQKMFWEKLTTLLNNKLGATRNMPGWRLVFQEMRTQVNLKFQNKSSTTTFTEMEVQLLNILKDFEKGLADLSFIECNAQENGDIVEILDNETNSEKLPSKENVDFVDPTVISSAKKASAQQILKPKISKVKANEPPPKTNVVSKNKVTLAPKPIADLHKKAVEPPIQIADLRRQIADVRSHNVEPPRQIVEPPRQIIEPAPQTVIEPIYEILDDGDEDMDDGEPLAKKAKYDEEEFVEPPAESDELSMIREQHCELLKVLTSIEIHQERTAKAVENMASSLQIIANVMQKKLTKTVPAPIKEEPRVT